MADKLERHDEAKVKIGTVYKGIRILSDQVEEIQKLDIREDDIFVCTYPRLGTTLIQEMVYLIATLDFETANSIYLDERFPFVDNRNPSFPYLKGVKMVEEMKSPRMVKSHFHHFMLPEQLRNGKGKIIYCARNPKDVITSFCKLFYWLNVLAESSFNDFIDDFINGTGYACPWTRHVLEYWHKSNDSNVLFLKYEDVIKDRPTTVRRIAKFLGRVLTDEDVERISEHCSLENMKRNNMTNFSYIEQHIEVKKDSKTIFINKGKPGGWRAMLTDDQSTKIDKMIDELKKAGLEITCT